MGYWSAAFDIESKDDHLEVSRDNPKLKCGKVNHLPEKLDVGKIKEDNLRYFPGTVGH